MAIRGSRSHNEATAQAAFRAAGQQTTSMALAALLRDGLRHNTALTELRTANHRLTDAVVTEGLLPLLLPTSILITSATAEPVDPPTPNRTLRRVDFDGSNLCDECLPAMAQIIASAKVHGVRELFVGSACGALEPKTLTATIEPALCPPKCW